MSKQWFIISVFTGSEKQVKNKLDKLHESDPKNFGEVKLPLRNKGEVRFSGYVFAEIDLFQNFTKKTKNQEVWNTLSEIDKIISPLGGDNIYPMSEEELLSLDKMLSDKEEKENKIVFNIGDSVKILEGAFTGNIGVISAIVNDTATVKIEIFGEEIKQEIYLRSLEKKLKKKIKRSKPIILDSDEFGHYLHEQLKFPRLPKERQITFYEPNSGESDLSKLLSCFLEIQIC